MQKISRVFSLAWVGTIASLSCAQSILPTQALSFGSFAPGTGSGTVTVSPTGVRSAGGGVSLVPSGSGQAASFLVTGNADAGYAITLPGNGEVSLTSGPHSMAVTTFTSSPSPAGQLGGGGSQTLTVGATLSVGPNQAGGSYSGSFIVTVVYN